MGFDLLPGPYVVAVLFTLPLPSPRGARLSRPSWGSSRCAIGSLHGWVGFLPVVRCTPCGWGLGCVRLVLVLCSCRWGCRGCWCPDAVCDCSPWFGCYTPCGPGSGYLGVVWCFRFGLWRGRCSRYVVIGRGLVPGPPVVVVLFTPLSPSPLGVRLCQRCWGYGLCAIGSLHGVPGAPRCAPYTVWVGLGVCAPGACPRILSLGLPRSLGSAGCCPPSWVVVVVGVLSVVVVGCPWASSLRSCSIMSYLCVACVFFLVRHVLWH